MEPVIIESETGRFRAEIVEQSFGKYKVRYFGPNGQDRGVKDDEENGRG